MMHRTSHKGLLCTFKPLEIPLLMLAGFSPSFCAKASCRRLRYQIVFSFSDYKIDIVEVSDKKKEEYEREELEDRTINVEVHQRD